MKTVFLALTVLVLAACGGPVGASLVPTVYVPHSTVVSTAKPAVIPTAVPVVTTAPPVSASPGPSPATSAPSPSPSVVAFVPTPTPAPEVVAQVTPSPIIITNNIASSNQSPAVKCDVYNSCYVDVFESGFTAFTFVVTEVPGYTDTGKVTTVLASGTVVFVVQHETNGIGSKALGGVTVSDASGQFVFVAFN